MGAIAARGSDQVDPIVERIAYEAFGERFPVALVVLDTDLRIIWASPNSATVLGHVGDGVVGLNVVDLAHPDDFEQVAPMLADVLVRAGEPSWSPAAASAIEVPVRVRTAAGAWVPTTVSGRVLDDSGRLVVLIRPAAERRALDQVVDGLGRGLELDALLSSVLGLVKSQFGVDRVWVAHDLGGVLSVLGDTSAPGVGSLVSWLTDLRRNGPSTDVVVAAGHWIAPVVSGTGESLLAIVILTAPATAGPNPYDLHVLQQSCRLASLAFTRAIDDRSLQHAATIDHLTGVVNRRKFEDQLARMALSADDLPVSVLFVDVDDFKAVNDEFGHGVGDAILRAVADRLVTAMRSCDIVGRLGGDEFAIACPSMPSDDAEAARRRLGRAFAVPFIVDDRSTSVQISVGLATAQTEDKLESLLGRSDADMYARKQVRC